MSRNLQRAVSLVLLFAMLFAQCPVLSARAAEEEMVEEAATDSTLLFEETQVPTDETEDIGDWGASEETAAQPETETLIPETETTEQTGEPVEQTELLLTQEDVPEEVAVEVEPDGQDDFLCPMEIPDDFVPPVADYGGLMEYADTGETALPLKYDSRDYGVITPVKNQGSYGLCWAFSAMAVGESSLISQGLSDNEIDLSEWHLGYFSQGKAYDPLGNAGEDRTDIFGNYLTVGFNNKYTTFAMANWIGAAAEDAYPYDSSLSGCDASAAVDDIAHLTNAYWISARDDTSNMKYYIMRNGCVGLSIYYSKSNLREDTASYYNSNYTVTNHAITVVGWDDDYSRNNFKTPPQNNGAWLCKNSYDTTFGKDGYFWLSYEDASINTSTSTAFVFEFDRGTDYERNYHYDGSYGVHGISLRSGSSVSNVFTAAGPGEETIYAVGMGISSADAAYSVQIYTDLSDPACPTSGTPVWSVPQTGRTNLCGYYSIALDEPVTVLSGETFAVVITLESSSGGNVSVFVDDSYNNSWISFSAHTEPNQSFMCSNSQGWSDLFDSGLTARIKAYTTATNTVPVSSLRFENEAVTLTPGDEYIQEPVREPEGAARCLLRWSSSAEDVASVDVNGRVTAHKAGDAEITVSVRYTDISATYQVSVLPAVQSVRILSRKLEMLPGEVFAPKAEILPADAAPYYTLTLSSADETVAKVEGNEIHALSPGTTAICFSAGKVQAEYTLTVQRLLEEAEISVESADFLGKTVTPAVTVTLEGENLKAGEDYTLQYRNNTKPGTGSVLVTGIGAYAGTVTREFSIQVPASEIQSVENEATGIRVTWDPIDGASGYELYRRGNSGAWKKITTISGGSKSSYLDRSGLSSGVLYDYRICTRVSASGRTYVSHSSQVQSLCRLTAPAISQIKATEMGFKLSWRAVSKADAYRVLRSDDGAPAVEIAYLAAEKNPAYLDETAVQKDVRYTYCVVSEKGTGEDCSVSAASSTRSACLPSSVELTEIRNETSGIALEWNASPCATGYLVYRSTNGVKWSKVRTISSGNTTSWTDTRCSSGVRYYYSVQSVAKLDGTVFGSGLSQPLSMYRLSTPRIKRITKAEEGFVVSWGKVSGADAYRVERRNAQNDSTETVLIEGGTSLRFADDAATQTGVLYEYRVTAVGNEDTSVESQPGLACNPEAPRLLSASNTARGIELRWEAAAFAGGYAVYRSTNGARWSKVGSISKGDTLTWTDASCASGTRYLYRVVSVVKLSGTSYSSEPSQILAQYRLSRPVIQKAAADPNGGYRVSWRKVTGANRYYLMRSEDGERPILVDTIEGGTVLQYQDATADQYGVKYTYTVIAGKTDADQENASCESVGKSVCRLAAPVLNSVELDGRKAVLRWEPVNLATGYRVYRSTDGKRWYLTKTISSGSTLTWTDTSRSASRTYVYRIAATGKLDGVTYVSEPSNEICQ